MATSVFGVQALEPFEEASSPPVSPQSQSHGGNPYEQSLQRYRSTSSVGSQSQSQRSPSGKGKSGSGRGFSLRRKKSGKTPGLDGLGEGEGMSQGQGEMGLMRTLSEQDNGVGMLAEERPGLVLAPTTELEEEQQHTVQEVVAPPAWKRRTSVLVKEEERRVRETLIAASSGQGQGQGQELVEQELEEPIDLRPPTAAFAKGASREAGSDRDLTGDSPRSSSSSLKSFERGSISSSTSPTAVAPTLHSRRSSAYGAAPQMASPLSKTAQEHEHHRHLRQASQVGGFEGMVPDMSNPTTPSGERPLDTIRRISMLSDGAYQAPPGQAGKRRGRGAVPAASAGTGRKKMSSETGMVGIPIDDSIWPSMPSEQANLPKPIKSRSVVSLASLNGGSLQNSKAKSTPASPIIPRKTMSRSSSRSNSSSTGTMGPAHHPAGLTMTAANRQQYIQTMQRDYSMRLGGHREGGYAIAATMNAPPSIHGLSGSVGDFGSMRYSGDWSGSGFYGDGTANSSRPSLPNGFHSNSTSSTSLSLPPQIIDVYPAGSTTSSSTTPSAAHPPSSYPMGMSTGMSSSPNQLQKTPSPLSRALSREDSMTGRQLVDSPEATVETPGAATPTPTKSKKELAKEAKETKARADREAREKAATAAKQRVEAEKQKKLQAKLDKDRAKQERKAKKSTTPSMTMADQVKGSSMPATPLKGKTQALAATPSTVPSTPVGAMTPAGGRTPLLDMGGSATPESRGASGLSQSTVIPDELLTPSPAPVTLTPATESRVAPATPIAPREQAESPRPVSTPRNSSTAATRTLKPKRSFWNTMRQVFTGSPTTPKQAPPGKPALTTRAPAADKGPLASLSVLSPNKTDSLTDSNATPSEYPSTETPVESAPSTVAEDAYANLRASTPPPVASAQEQRPTTPTQPGSVGSPNLSPVSLRTYNNKRNSQLGRIQSTDTFQVAQDTQLPISRQTSAASHHYSPPPSLGQVV